MATLNIRASYNVFDKTKFSYCSASLMVFLKITFLPLIIYIYIIVT